jgi:hypothetical protein
MIRRFKVWLAEYNLKLAEGNPEHADSDDVSRIKHWLKMEKQRDERKD